MKNMTKHNGSFVEGMIRNGNHKNDGLQSMNKAGECVKLETVEYLGKSYAVVSVNNYKEVRTIIAIGQK